MFQNPDALWQRAQGRGGGGGIMGEEEGEARGGWSTGACAGGRARLPEALQLSHGVRAGWACGWDSAPLPPSLSGDSLYRRGRKAKIQPCSESLAARVLGQADALV